MKAVYLAATLILATPLAARAVPPHIVVIVADDLGYADAQTPHLSRLRGEGVSLGAHYSHPTCSPTRAALLTGRYGFRVGVPRVTTKGRKGGDLHANVITLAELLGAAGYETAAVGKWHVGGSPLAHGFEHYYGWPDVPAPTHWRPDGRYGTEVLGDEAVRRISERDATRPLFLYLAFNAPHFPLQAPQEYLARFPHLRWKRRVYAAMVAALDDQVGRVCDALRDAGMDRNTVLVFQSDNGGDMHHGATNGALRGGKTTPYEGGVRVTSFAWYPSRWAPRETEALTHTIDWLPTLASMAGCLVPPEVEGVDLNPLLTHGLPVRAGLLVAHDARAFTVYREGRWKLIQQRGGRRVELYDLANDPGERRNVARLYPDVVARLRGLARETAD